MRPAARSRRSAYTTPTKATAAAIHARRMTEQDTRLAERAYNGAGVFTMFNTPRLASAALLLASGAALLAQGSSFKYPTPRKGDASDNYFGTTVADPYRWM